MRDYCWKYKRRTKPSGFRRVSLRLRADLLDRLIVDAVRHGKSLDDFIAMKLEEK